MQTSPPRIIRYRKPQFQGRTRRELWVEISDRSRYHPLLSWGMQVYPVAIDYTRPLGALLAELTNVHTSLLHGATLATWDTGLFEGMREENVIVMSARYLGTDHFELLDACDEVGVKPLTLRELIAFFWSYPRAPCFINEEVRTVAAGTSPPTVKDENGTLALVPGVDVVEEKKCLKCRWALHGVQYVTGEEAGDGCAGYRWGKVVMPVVPKK